MNTKKASAVNLLEELAGGPLSLADLLLAIRQGEESSQVEFAQTLEISRSHLCDIEKGRKAVSPSRAAQFARKLGYSERQFVELALQDQVQNAGLDLQVRLVPIPG